MITIQNLTFGGTFTYETPNLPPAPIYYLWTWGDNSAGQLGQGNTTNRSSPTQVGALTTWSKLTTGVYGFVIATKTDGTLWAWGSNGDGKLGLGNTTARSSPVQVGALTTWLQVSAGFYHSAAVKTDGTLWTWGRNAVGALGLGNTTYYSSPKQVGALTTWSKISCGGIHNLAIKTDGTLWAWGYGDNGQLGLGTTPRLNSPAQVGSATNWASISGGWFRSSHAITTGGTLWSWGLNSNGELGLGNTTTYYTPIQVGALTTWASVTSGSDAYTAAIKTDGTLWTWGANSGNLGLGDTANRSSPVQVGALTTWSIVSNGLKAIKTDGTLWAWGDNSVGQLGQGNTTNRSSPVQVGALTTWQNVFGNAAIG